MELVLTTGYIMTLYSLASVHKFSQCSLCIPYGAAKGNLFDNQELHNLVIISFILMILMFCSAVIR